jgi:hypothetical protein
MSIAHPRFVVDENQKPTDVVLTLSEWEDVVEALEELDAIRAYDLAKAGDQGSVSLEEMKKLLDGSPE